MLTHRAAAHNATLPFTRNVVGPMDYTPGTFSDSQHPHITTHAHELALPVVFESALQHMPDRPSVYYGLPEQVRQFLSVLPTAWDDTKLLAGYPGTEVVMARRKGDVWYIAGINGTDESRVIGVPLETLGLEKGRKVTWFKDGSDRQEFRDGRECVFTGRRKSCASGMSSAWWLCGSGEVAGVSARPDTAFHADFRA